MFSLYKFLFVFKRMGPRRPSHMALTASSQEALSQDELSNALSLACSFSSTRFHCLLQPLSRFACFSKASASFVCTDSFPWFFLSISKNFCWYACCGSRVLSDYALKTEGDSPHSTTVWWWAFFFVRSISSATQPREGGQRHEQFHLVQTEAGRGASRLVFQIPSLVWRSSEVVTPSTCLCTKAFPAARWSRVWVGCFSLWGRPRKSLLPCRKGAAAPSCFPELKSQASRYWIEKTVQF